MKYLLIPEGRARQIKLCAQHCGVEVHGRRRQKRREAQGRTSKREKFLLNHRAAEG